MAKRCKTAQQWILIDWDDCDSPPTRPASHLAKDNHSPEVFEAGHGGEVDIWGVGRLITDASLWITGLSHNIIELGERMQSNNKPSVYDALNFLKSLTIIDQRKFHAKQMFKSMCISSCRM